MNSRRLSILSLTLAALLFGFLATPVQAATPPDTTYGTLTCSAKTTLYGGHMATSSTDGVVTGWYAVGQMQTCIEVSSTRLRAKATFYPYSGWKWIEGYFHAQVATCGGAAVNDFITTVYSQSSSAAVTFVSSSVARSSTSYQARAYITTHSHMISNTGEGYALFSTNPWHDTAQYVKSACGK